MVKRPWAKGREKGVKAVRLDLQIHEIAQHFAEKEGMSLKDFIAQCVLNACKMHTSDTSNEAKVNYVDDKALKEIADKLITEHSDFWKSLANK